MDLLQGFQSYGGLQLRGSGYSQIFKLLVLWQNVLEVQERAQGVITSALCQVWWGSDFARCQGG